MPIRDCSPAISARPSVSRRPSRRWPAAPAGEARAGEVLIQTEFPEHPLLNRLIAEGYEGFAASALEERREAGWPPYSRLAMLRAEAKDSGGLDLFLRAAAESGGHLNEASVKVLGPRQRLDCASGRSLPGASADRNRGAVNSCSDF